MDIQEALSAIAAIRSEVPEEDRHILDMELASRYNQIAEVAGPVAVINAAETVKDLEKTKLEVLLPIFLNHNNSLGLSEQLATMQEFWGSLGYNLPELNQEQQLRLSAVLTAHPTHRLVAAPLLDYAGRHSLVDKAIALVGDRPKAPSPYSDLYNTVRKLITPTTKLFTGQLFVDPENIIYEGSNMYYAMGYKSPIGTTPVSRGVYIKQLLATGKAVKDERGTPWTFSVMDARTSVPRNRDYAINQLMNLSPTQTPESIIALQLLHHVNNTLKTNLEYDLVNESIYEVNQNGSIKKMFATAAVSFSPSTGWLHLEVVPTHYESFYNGVRSETSGL